MSNEEEKHAVRPDWVTPVKDAIRRIYFPNEDNTENFCQLLKDTGSVIAGGFVLRAISDPSDLTHGDMDIYVPIPQTNTFIRRMFIENPLFDDLKGYSNILSSLYCRSFLRKNGIRGVKTYTLHISHDGNETYPMIDMMPVRNERGVVNVVTNFDLTFCQVWFDGETVRATHPEHIEQRRGLLRNDYISTFLTGNRFLKKRLRKYRSRGYQIAYETLPSYDVKPYLEKRRVPGCHAEKLAIQPHLVRRTLVQHTKHPHLLGLPNITPTPFYEYERTDQKDNSMMVSVGHPRMHSFRYKRIIEYDKSLLINEYEDVDSDDERSLDWVQEQTQEYYLHYVSEMVLNTLAPKAASTLPYNWNMILQKESTSDIVEELKESIDKNLYSILPSGKDQFGFTGPLFFIHHHTQDQGITEQGAKSYILSTRENTDNKEDTDLKCFITDCKEPITLREQLCFTREDPADFPHFRIIHEEFYESWKDKLTLPDVFPYRYLRSEREPDQIHIDFLSSIYKRYGIPRNAYVVPQPNYEQREEEDRLQQENEDQANQANEE